MAIPLNDETRGGEGEGLFIGTAVLGDLEAQNIMIYSSGIHVVEDYVGSSAQLYI